MARPLTPKGEARREALVAAAAALVVEEGVAAVTFRSVAARAGLPLASTTYYFADRSDLVLAAATRGWEDDLRRARAAAEAPTRVRGARVRGARANGARVHGARAAAKGGTAARASRTSRAVAGSLVDVVLGAERVADPGRLAGFYARVAEAARTPELVPHLSRWQDAVLDVVAAVLDRHGAEVAPRTALALVDGSALQALSDGRAGREPLVDAVGTALAPLLEPTRG